MKTKTIIKLLATAAAIGVGTGAHAEGTLAGTGVNNTATIGYSTGNVAQTPVSSNVATFVVDEKINLMVAELGGAETPVAPGGSGYVTTFTVTNTSNSPQDFRLVATQDTTGLTTAFGGTDAFNTTNIKVYVDNGDGIFDPATDTATFIDELGADQSKTVFIVSDVPITQLNGDVAGVTLTAIAANNGTVGTLGADQVQSTGADDAGVVDIVFADGAGDVDGLRDGQFSDDDQYTVSAATVALLKTSKIISDPFNGTTNPKRIPGAIVEYCIVAQNTGSAAATSSIISDNLATVLGVTYVPGSLYTGVTVASGLCNSDGTVRTDGADGDGGTFAGTTVSGDIGTLAAATSTAIRFRVSIN